jgi:hypothetical protein
MVCDFTGFRRYLTLGGLMPHEGEVVVAKYPEGANLQHLDPQSTQVAHELHTKFNQIN